MLSKVVASAARGEGELMDQDARGLPTVSSFRNPQVSLSVTGVSQSRVTLLLTLIWLSPAES